MGWTIQGSARKGGKYCQAVWGSGTERVRVTLGTLTKEQEAAALDALKRVGDKILRWPAPDVRAYATDPDAFKGKLKGRVREAVAGESDIGFGNVSSAVRSWALDGADAVVDEVVSELRQREAEAIIAKGRFGDLPLREFVREVWAPIRSRKPGTWKREQRLWNPILASTLGDTKVKELNLVGWDRFLQGRTTWKGRTRSLAQNASTPSPPPRWRCSSRTRGARCTGRCSRSPLNSAWARSPPSPWTGPTRISPVLRSTSGREKRAPNA
ncbi:MAG: hypothetical protein Q8P18_19540 [Pseudomonadota bacterium]|nr:hypothetical protein [Pseudomonadota bacterium]